MDPKKKGKIYQCLIGNAFEEAYNEMNIYINYPDNPAEKEQTAINARKKEMLTLAQQSGYDFNDPKYDLSHRTYNLSHPEIKVIKELLTGGNRHTKRTKRTTNRKMRKSLIRRRR